RPLPSAIAHRLLNEDCLPTGSERLPFEPALGALERPQHVVIGGVPGARVGLGQRHLVVDVGVLAAQPPAAGGTGSPPFQFAEPPFHPRPPPPGPDQVVPGCSALPACQWSCARITSR